MVLDCSQCPVHPPLKSTFLQFAKQTADTSSPRRRPILFMTSAYQGRAGVTGNSAERYTIAGNDNDALVIQTGLACAKAIAETHRTWNLLSTGSATPHADRDLPGGVHDLCGGVPQIAGRQHLHRGHRSRHRPPSCKTRRNETVREYFAH